MTIDYSIGSATDLPWPEASVDICLLPELLEHVTDWRQCLDEASRILKPGGLLYLSTSNKLCPVQNEFTLPMYSWYPGFIKRYCERLAVTSKPQWVNYASYPAVNWFSFYGLRKELGNRGVAVIDKIQFNATIGGNDIKGRLFKLISALPPLRFLAHVLTPYTIVVGVKK